MSAAPTLSAADLLAFDSQAADAGGAWHLMAVVPIAPISTADVLGLVAQVRWPTGCPLGPAIAAAAPSAVDHDDPALDRDRQAASSNHWHAIPHQGIDGAIDDFHLLVGTPEFIEDAGINIELETAELLGEHYQRGWTSVVVGACHASGNARSPRRSLLAVLAFTPARTDVAEAVSERRAVVGADVVALGGFRFNPSPTLIWGLALAVFSAALGLWASTLRVATGELAVVSRFGRIVAHLEAGLHIRPFWPVEQVARLYPHEIRTLELGNSSADKMGVASLGELLLSGDTRRAIPMDDTEDPSAIPEPQLLAAAVRVQYMIADPVAYLQATTGPDHLLATAAESVLRSLLASRSLSTAVGPQRGDLASLLQRSLQQRIDDYGCGLAIHNVVIDDLLSADMLGEAARVEEQIDDRERIRRDGLLMKARNQAERITQDAQADVADLLADAQIDQERTAKLAMSVLEWVRAYAPAFRRDPQHTRQQIVQVFRVAATTMPHDGAGGESPSSASRPAQEVQR